MNTFKKICLAAATVAFASLVPTSPASAAGTISATRITIVNLYGSSTTPYVILSMAAPATGAPGCSQFTAAMAIDPSTNRGKHLLNLATAAFLSGRNVTLVGSGFCVSPTGFGLSLETVNYLSMQ